MSTTYYETLEVPRTASRDEIKRSYRRKAAKAHPDRGGSESEFRDLAAAWACLRDPVRRLTYDQTGIDQSSPIEEEARGVLVIAIGQSIAADVNGSLLDQVRKLLSEMRDRIDDAKSQHQAAADKLQKRRDKVRRKKKRGKRSEDTPNLFHAVLDQMIEAAKTAIAKCDRGVDVHSAAIKMLGEYESDEEVATAKWPSIRAIDSATFSWKTV